MISIAMTTYNGEQYIKEQIESILSQTYKDFELIVCDDRSTDSTWSILQEYECKDNRIHCFLNDMNLGVAKNFEKTIKLCKGDYITFSDQDDIWIADHLEVLLKNIGDNLVCCGDALLIEKNGNEKGINLKDMYGDLPITVLDNIVKKLIRILYYGNVYAGCVMLAKKEILKTALPFPLNINCHDLWLVLCACVQNSFVYVPIPVIKYRRHDANVSELNKKKSLISFIINKRNGYEIFNDRNLFCQYLLERHDNIDPEIKKLLFLTKNYYENRSNRICRFKFLPFWIANFQYIYLTKSRRIFFLRLLQYLFF
jgi:glycosyltransferase involved in cell wall biosynthesis